MTVRERVFASRLMERIDSSEKYSDEIGLSGVLVKNEISKHRLTKEKSPIDKFKKEKEIYVYQRIHQQ